MVSLKNLTQEFSKTGSSFTVMLSEMSSPLCFSNNNKASISHNIKTLTSRINKIDYVVIRQFSFGNLWESSTLTRLLIFPDLNLFEF